MLVIAFTYFYTAIIINPQMMADDMKRNGGFIPGVKPGKMCIRDRYKGKGIKFVGEQIRRKAGKSAGAK